jgi:uncharacterized protein (DUF3084 family)
MNDKTIKGVRVAFEKLIKDLEFIKDEVENVEYEQKEVKKRAEIVLQKDNAVSKKLIETKKWGESIIAEKEEAQQETKKAQEVMAKTMAIEERVDAKREEIAEAHERVEKRIADLEYLEKREQSLNDYKKEIDELKLETDEKAKVIGKEN